MNVVYFAQLYSAITVKKIIMQKIININITLTYF